jgi:hypothetical protein
MFRDLILSYINVICDIYSCPFFFLVISPEMFGVNLAVQRSALDCIRNIPSCIKSSACDQCVTAKGLSVDRPTEHVFLHIQNLWRDVIDLWALVQYIRATQPICRDPVRSVPRVTRSLEVTGLGLVHFDRHIRW